MENIARQISSPVNAQPHGEYEFHLSRTTASLIALFCGKRLQARLSSMERALRLLGQVCIDERNGGNLTWAWCREILLAHMSAPRVRRVITWLVSASVLIEMPDGSVRIHNFEKNNRTYDEWLEVRQLRRAYLRDAKRTQRQKSTPIKKTKRSFGCVKKGSEMPNSQDVNTSTLREKIQSPSTPSSPLPTYKSESMAGIGTVLAAFNLPTETPKECEGAQARASQKREGKGEGDCVDKGEGGIANYFAARGATMAATKPDGLDAKMAAFDAWQAAQRARNARQVDAAPKAAKQAGSSDKAVAPFVPPADDADLADTQWLYQHVCCILALRMLNLQKTVACGYTRGQVRAAAASLVSRQPADCRMPLGLFIDAMRKMQGGVFEDARLRHDIRVAKHGWSEKLYELAGRWPKTS